MTEKEAIEALKLKGELVIEGAIKRVKEFEGSSKYVAYTYEC